MPLYAACRERMWRPFQAVNPNVGELKSEGFDGVCFVGGMMRPERLGVVEGLASADYGFGVSMRCH